MTPPVAVVGLAQTRHRERNREASTPELIHEVARGAAASAGLDRSEIDTVVEGASDLVDGIAITNVYSVAPSGAYLKDESRVEDDAAFAAFYAWARILSGLHETALVVGWGKLSEVDPEGPARLGGDPFYLRPVGLGAVEAAALQAGAYLESVGEKAEAVAPWTVRERALALENPNAHAGARLTVEEVRGAEPVASPLRRWDLPPRSDGAAAIVLASQEAVRERGLHPIAWILGAGTATDSYSPGARDLAAVPSARAAAGEAYRRAGGIDPAKEIRSAEISEPSSLHGPMLVEALGLAQAQEGIRMVRDGKFPLNPSGGRLGATPGPATGLVRIIEAARQAGEGGISLAHAGSGLALQSNVVFVLGPSEGKGT